MVQLQRILGYCPLCGQDCDEKRANRCTAQCRHHPAIRRLKKLCKLAEINEEIRTATYKGHERIDEIVKKWELIVTHTGRRTFIIHALSRGIPPSIVMRWTGDSDYKSMKPYIDIVDEIKASEMTKMNFMEQFYESLQISKKCVYLQHNNGWPKGYYENKLRRSDPY